MSDDVLRQFGPEHAWGGSDIREADPDIEAWSDVCWLPGEGEPGTGVFDRDGCIVESTLDLGFPQDPAAPASPPARVDAAAVQAVTETAPDPAYVYGGGLSHNYGHFLVDTLSRYWPWAGTDSLGAFRGLKILVRHPAPQAFLAEHGYARALFAGIGLSPEDFVSFARPTRVRRLIVPRTSFGHQSYAHRIYARLGDMLGARLMHGRTPSARDRPVYLSKSKLTGGIRRFVDETALEARLAEAGVEIIHPERLSLPDQIALFVERPAIVGLAGSAFHTGVFASERPRTLLLSPRLSINSNFVLFDRLIDARSSYHQVVGARFLPEAGDFHRQFEIGDVVKVADAILKLL